MQVGAEEEIGNWVEKDLWIPLRIWRPWTRCQHKIEDVAALRSGGNDSTIRKTNPCVLIVDRTPKRQIAPVNVFADVCTVPPVPPLHIHDES